MRVILDTNIMLSALIRGDSVPGRIFEAWFDDRFALLTHPLQLDELRAVARSQQIRSLIRPSEAGRLVNDIRAHAELVTQLPHIRRSADPFDDFLLGMSDAGKVDYLVTADKSGLLKLEHHDRTAILTARAFLDPLTR